jgi:hypothetical protein
MFEGKPPRIEESPAETLRPLAWSELAMRLAAARELRASLVPGELQGEASFDAISARWIAAHSEGKAFVNPEASANGKGTGHNEEQASPGYRGGAVRE